MAAAISDFLQAAGLSLSGELRATPRRVADLWAEEFLDGYAIDPRTVLGALHPSPNAGAICVTGVEFQSACPHHLLPYRGLCHLGYLPRGGDDARVAGFSRLAALVDALSHRLVLQEALCTQIAGALLAATGARSAGCILQAEQACLSCRDGRKARARTHTSAYLGERVARSELREELMLAVAKAGGAGQRSVKEPR
jgi:GTP cyclohydrolase I